jgi:hypothetical protein
MAASDPSSKSPPYRVNVKATLLCPAHSDTSRTRGNAAQTTSDELLKRVEGFNPLAGPGSPPGQTLQGRRGPPEWLRKPVYLRGSGLRVASLTRVGCGLAVPAHVPTAHSADEEDQASQSPEADAEVVAAT